MDSLNAKLEAPLLFPQLNVSLESSPILGPWSKLFQRIAAGLLIAERQNAMEPSMKRKADEDHRGSSEKGHKVSQRHHS